MSEPRYEAVFWDIGGVILDLDSVPAGYRAFVGELATSYDLDEEHAVETWRRELGTYFGARDGTAFKSAREGYHRAIAAMVGHEIPDEEWVPLYEDTAIERLEPVAGSPEAIRRLDEDGRVHQGVVSDIDTWEAERLLERFDIETHLDAVTTSEEVGRTKPDPVMFETALERAGVEPERALMIGDRYRNDMVGASRAGIHPVAFGGSAAEADRDDPVIDHRIEDPRAIFDIVGIERGGR